MFAIESCAYNIDQINTIELLDRYHIWIIVVPIPDIPWQLSTKLPTGVILTIKDSFTIIGEWSTYLNILSTQD